MAPPNTNPLDQLIPVIAKAVTEWQDRQSPEAITEQIHTFLDTHTKDVVMRLLGFEPGYSPDSWQVDGSTQSSTVGAYLHNQRKEAVHDWLETMQMPELTKTETKRLAASMKREYLRRLKMTLEREVKEQADRDAKALIGEISESHNIDNYLRLLSLIHHPKPSET